MVNPKAFIILVAFFVALSCSAQKYKADLKEDNLLGKVKSIEQTRKCLDSAKETKTPCKDHTFIKKYNTQGNLILEKHSNLSRALFYNNKGNIVKTETQTEGLHPSSHNVQYFYNDTGGLFESVETFENGIRGEVKQVCKFNFQGDEIAKEHFYKDSTLNSSYTTICQYNGRTF